MGLPPELTVNEYEELTDGILDKCEEYDITLIGGDINQNTEIILCGTSIGKVNDEFKLQTDIKPDDLIAVTGELGGPAAALDLIYGNNDIPEEDWQDAVQIIGWMYQFYNIEPKAKVFSKSGGAKITKEEIPAATQLFTPEWIVKYMVENSLGKLWIEGHPDDNLKANWKYYLDEAEQEPEVESQLQKIRADYANIKPEEIKVIDPCMGSGHILVYAFDVLMQIYQTSGYGKQEAVRLIIERNLYGLDIDDRAAQLAYFTVMMKARQYDRRFRAVPRDQPAFPRARDQ